MAGSAGSLISMPERPHLSGSHKARRRAERLLKDAKRR
jgi:hypothetical protein